MKKTNDIDNEKIKFSDNKNVTKKIILISFSVLFVFLLIKTLYVFNVSFIKPYEIEYINETFGVDMLYLT